MWRLIIILMAALVVSACASTNQWVELTPEPGVESAPFHISGTVKYIDVEGGVFVIQDVDGTRYNPINLPDTFKSDGMSVEAEARRREDLVSAAMIGPIIELLRIRSRS